MPHEKFCHPNDGTKPRVLRTLGWAVYSGFSEKSIIILCHLTFKVLLNHILTITWILLK
jgi:hypothetical protein